MRALRRIASNSPGLFAFTFFLLASVVIFAVPVLGEPDGVVGSNAPDARLFIWGLGYWPHALVHGGGLLETHAIYYPEGYHLFWTTLVPLVSLLLWPVTALFGATTSYSVAVVLAPALSAWAAFLLCRELTDRVGPSLLGGWLYGFSSYLLATTAGGHLHASWVWLFPLVALLIVRMIRGRQSARSYTALLTLALIAEFLISTEMTLILGLSGAIALIVAWFALPERRTTLRATIRWSVVAGVAAAVLCSPILISILTDGARPHVPTETGVIDFLNPFFPTELTWAGHSTFAPLSQHYVGNPYTRAGYLGPALMVLLFLWGLRAWQRGSREERLLLGLGIGALLLTFGAALKVTGLTTIPMPWKVLSELPLLRYVLAYRFMAVAALAIAVIVALWLSRPGGRPRWRWGLAAAAVLLLFPQAGAAIYRYQQPVPAFFADGGWKRVLRPDDRVFALPYGPYGSSMLWQARAGYGFDLVGGYVESPPSGYETPLIQELNQRQTFDPADADELRAFLRSKGATVIVVDQTDPGPGTAVLDALGLRAQAVDGVLVARLP